ncbi:manganese-dependent ADP-ribose/CDP-alcohol diphosphatase [Marchantia polymorpha subsp. ruderalis]
MGVLRASVLQTRGPLLLFHSTHRTCMHSPIIHRIALRPEFVRIHCARAYKPQREITGVLAEQQPYSHLRDTLVLLDGENPVVGKSVGAEKFPAKDSIMNKVDLAFKEANSAERQTAVEVWQNGRIELSLTSSPSSRLDVTSRSKVDLMEVDSILFSFGVITDVQYADIPDGFSFGGTPRFYRHALEVQHRAVTEWNEHGKISFAIHFGDLVDGKCPKEESSKAVSQVLAIFDSFHGGPVYHMIGNHCLYNLPRAELNRVFSIPPSVDGRSYYDFCPAAGFRFVVLDGYDISVLGWPEDHPHVQLATHMLNSVNPNADKNSPVGLDGLMARFVMFNGGVGRDQLAWLNIVLHNASRAGEKVVICSHLPLHPDSASPSCLCWNFDEVLDLLHRHDCVVACFSGHAHSGGYTQDSCNIHHVVLEAVLECPPGENAYGRVDVFHDRLSLRGIGRMVSRDLFFH